MKKSLLLSTLVYFAFFFFMLGAQQSTLAATIGSYCNNNSDCPGTLICVDPCANTTKKPSSPHCGGTCLHNFDCPKGTNCAGADPVKNIPGTCVADPGVTCANPKNSASCKKKCENPPPTHTNTTAPPQCGGACMHDSDCPKGTNCAGADQAHYIFGTCVPDPGVTCASNLTPTDTPLPPPPSPPCTNWNSGQCSKFDTALGAFSTNPSGFIVTIFAILLSISGALAILLIIKAGYQLMTSQGKPEQIQQGRDQLIAAIIGLVFLVFSFVFLQVIGFDILHIPGFGP